ncbi:OsmC family protein [Flavobacterium sp.]|uniref:OsmC family protein n=1 Tax=Flavobacterium sp. TaxID=239 RepID=UPI00286B021D|nr:OsmC family protein [Flavobacterium sp.]
MGNRFEEDILGHIGTQKYKCTIVWRNGKLIMDEPESIGGGNLGPDPFSTLLASLAGCTLSTLRMYIDRKGWDIPQIDVALNMEQKSDSETTTIISRRISFPEVVSAEQKERLLTIAEKCPISKLLKGNTIINTTL